MAGDADAEDEIGDAAREFPGLDAVVGDMEEVRNVAGGAAGVEFEQTLIVAGVR